MYRVTFVNYCFVFKKPSHKWNPKSVQRQNFKKFIDLFKTSFFFKYLISINVFVLEDCHVLFYLKWEQSGCTHILCKL